MLYLERRRTKIAKLAINNENKTGPFITLFYSVVSRKTSHEIFRVKREVILAYQRVIHGERIKKVREEIRNAARTRLSREWGRASRPFVNFVDPRTACSRVVEPLKLWGKNPLILFFSRHQAADTKDDLAIRSKGFDVYVKQYTKYKHGHAHTAWKKDEWRVWWMSRRSG